MSPIYSENQFLYHTSEMKVGEEVIIEVFEYNLELAPHFTSVRGISFLESGDVCIFIDKYNHSGIPGGKVEKGETADQAVIREIDEEINAAVIKYRPLGITKYTFTNSGDVNYMLMYQCLVDLKDGEVNDPDDDITRRKVVSFSEFRSIFENSRHNTSLINLIDPGF